MKRLLFSLAAVVAVGLTASFLNGRAAAQMAASPTPPPSPPPVSGPSPAPTPMLPPGALPTPPPGGTVTVPLTLGTPKPKGSATPSPPPNVDANRVGISGVWEVQIQRSSDTAYTHFKLDQKGSVLTGEYLDTDGKKYPLAGSIDNKTVRVVVSLPNGSSMIFTGQQDNRTDMYGLLALANDSVPFTAAYRPKFKWIENVAPGGSGMPGIP